MAVATKHIGFTKDQLDKIGNTAIYLSERILDLSKTKLLKLFYLLDEISIMKSGIPFLNLQYKVWKFGPVPEALFIDLSSDLGYLRRFVKADGGEGVNQIKAAKAFSDDEFSDKDVELMDWIIEKYGDLSAHDLVEYTHRPQSLWYQTALKYGVLELLQQEKINSTDYFIDMKQLVAQDSRKLGVYEQYKEAH